MNRLWNSVCKKSVKLASVVDKILADLVCGWKSGGFTQVINMFCTRFSTHNLSNFNLLVGRFYTFST